MILTIALQDQLPSGKNSIKDRYINGKKIRYPNKRFVDWRTGAGNEILIQKMKWPAHMKAALPLRSHLILAVSYRELEKVPAKGDRDLTGMTDAIQHLLEYCEVIESDGQIKGLIWEYPWRTEGPGVIFKLTEGGYGN